MRWGAVKLSSRVVILLLAERVAEARWGRGPSWNGLSNCPRYLQYPPHWGGMTGKDVSMVESVKLFPGVEEYGHD